jgi:hypothetical protein
MTDASENWLKSIVPFIVMCFGGFMALLDIQIVASSLQNIGGGLSAAQDSNTRPDHRRLDHRRVELALAVLCQSRVGHSNYAVGPVPGRFRQT